jgi:hypothetical protein
MLPLASHSNKIKTLHILVPGNYCLHKTEQVYMFTQLHLLNETECD